MKSRQFFLYIALGMTLLSFISIPIIQNHWKEPEHQPEPERNMLGWPVSKRTPEQQRKGWEMAMKALRESTVEQEEKVTALRSKVASLPDSEPKAAELEHAEKILAAMKLRLEEEELANKVVANDRNDALRISRHGFNQLWPDIIPPTEVSVTETSNSWVIVYPPDFWIDPDGSARPATDTNGVLCETEFIVHKIEGRVTIRPITD